MDEDKNVNNIKRHQEKALLWRMVSYNYNTIDLIIIALLLEGIDQYKTF